MSLLSLHLSSKLEVVRATLKSIPAYLSVLITRSAEVRGQIGLTGKPLNTHQLMIARPNEGNAYSMSLMEGNKRREVKIYNQNEKKAENVNEELTQHTGS